MNNNKLKELNKLQEKIKLLEQILENRSEVESISLRFTKGFSERIDIQDFKSVINIIIEVVRAHYFALKDKFEEM